MNIIFIYAYIGKLYNIKNYMNNHLKIINKKLLNKGKVMNNGNR